MHGKDSLWCFKLILPIFLSSTLTQAHRLKLLLPWTCSREPVAVFVPLIILFMVRNARRVKGDECRQHEVGLTEWIFQRFHFDVEIIRKSHAAVIKRCRRTTTCDRPTWQPPSRSRGLWRGRVAATIEGRMRRTMTVIAVRGRSLRCWMIKAADEASHRN